MTTLKLPINNKSWLSTITRWGAELRAKNLLSTEDSEWQNWDPQFSSPGGILTLSNIDIRVARYSRAGKTVHFHLYVGLQTGGAGFPFIVFTPPIASGKLSYGAPTFPCVVIDGASLPGTAILEDSLVYVAKYTYANWGLGTGRYIRCSGFYEID